MSTTGYRAHLPRRKKAFWMPEQRPSRAQLHTFAGCGDIWGAAMGFAGDTRNQGCVVSRGVMCCDMRNLMTVAESSSS